MAAVEIMGTSLEHRSKNQTVVDSELYDFMSSDHSDTAMMALSHLLRRPWFGRIWVVQETVLAKRVKLICGRKTLAWDLWVKGIQFLLFQGLYFTLAGSSSGLIPHGILNTMVIAQFRDSKVLQLEQTLESVLIHTKSFKSSDPKDKLFAVLAMAGNTEHPALSPDYQNLAQNVFTRSTAYLITKTGAMDIIHAAGIGWERALVDLLSWVPDWSANGVISTMSFRIESGGYNADNSGLVNIVFIRDPRLLKVEGLVLDSVDVIYGSENLFEVPQEATSCYYWQDVVRWFEKLESLIDTLAPYPTGERSKEVLWRTLTGNLTHEGKPASLDYQKYFESYIDSIKRAAYDEEAPLSEVTSFETRKWLQAFDKGRSVREVFTTHSGYLGLAPPGAISGDIVCLLFGGKTPFLLRNPAPIEGHGTCYKLVGDCYMHGLMNGEALSMGEAQDILLV